MMIKMNKKLKTIMEDTTEREKIRLFYELGKHFLENSNDIDECLEELYDDIANVINDIDNL